MSIFNAEEFLSKTFTESSIKSLPPMPPGEYIGTVKPGSLALRFVGAESTPVLDMLFTVTDPAVVAATKQAEPAVKYTCWLEKGANGVDIKNSANLGRLRDAIGLNTEGQPWSFEMFGGRQARILVGQRQGNDGNTYSQVTKVTKP